MNRVGWRICVAHSSRSLINGDGSPVLRVFTKSPVEISFHRTLETFSGRFYPGKQYGNVENAIIRKKKFAISRCNPQRKLMEWLS